MGRLALTCRILYDYDILQKANEILALKAGIASDFLQGDLQGYFGRDQ